MTVDDCRLLAWFLQQTRPVTVRHLMDEFDLPERKARRRLAVFRRAGMAKPAGFDGPRYEWLPVPPCR